MMLPTCGNLRTVHYASVSCGVQLRVRQVLSCIKIIIKCNVVLFYVLIWKFMCQHCHCVIINKEGVQ